MTESPADYTPVKSNFGKKPLELPQMEKRGRGVSELTCWAPCGAGDWDDQDPLPPCPSLSRSVPPFRREHDFFSLWISRVIPHLAVEHWMGTRAGHEQSVT